MMNKSAAAAALFLLSSSTTLAFQTVSPLSHAKVSTGSTTSLESSIYNKPLTRVSAPRRGGYSGSDENYDYRRSGYGRGSRGRDRQGGGGRWSPTPYGSEYRSNPRRGGGGRDWYDGTSASAYGRERGRRDGFGNRWSPTGGRNGYYGDRGYRGYDGEYGSQIQGSSRRTFSKMGGGYNDDQTVVELGSDGRPLNANVETWEGPNNVRSNLNFYSEDGYDYGVRVLSGARHGSWNDETVSIRNTGPMEYPIDARMDNVQNRGYDSYGGDFSNIGARRNANGRYQREFVRELNGEGSFGTLGAYGTSYGSSDYRTPTGANAKIIQGDGATKHWQLSPDVESVRVELHSQGLPIMARIELLQGPNNVKTLGEVYQEDGYDRPFVCVMDTGGEFNYNKGTIQIVNEGPMAFPITAVVEAQEVYAGAYGYGY